MSPRVSQKKQSQFSRHWKVFSVLLGIALLLGPYQNCALHQSDGRKQLEQILASKQSAQDFSCLPFLSENEVDNFFGGQFNTTASIFVTSDGPTCKITSPQDKSGLEVAICTLHTNLQFLSTPTDIHAVVGPLYGNMVYYYHAPAAGQAESYVEKVTSAMTPSVPNGESSYFGVGVEQGNFIQFHFIGALPELGLECRFSIDKADFGNADIRREATKRGSLLMHALYNNCLNSKCAYH